MSLTNRSAANFESRYHQHGAVLAVSLILLLVITLIAVASMRGTILEERMAGNTRDRNLAFQTTESAIREAEQFVDGVVSLGNFDGSAGLFGLTDGEPDFTLSTTWTDATQHVSATGSYDSAQAPLFYIKHFTTVTGTEGALNMSGYGDNKGSGDVTVFKITSRGTGGSSDSAEVILRSHYGRIF